MSAGHTSGGLPENASQPEPSDEVRHERERIARLLHDTVCQEITGIGLLVNAMANQQRAASPAVAQQLMEIAEMIHRTGAATQEIMRGLHGES